jgi:hypothetical protein
VHDRASDQLTVLTSLAFISNMSRHPPTFYFFQVWSFKWCFDALGCKAQLHHGVCTSGCTGAAESTRCELIPTTQKRKKSNFLNFLYPDLSFSRFKETTKAR